MKQITDVQALWALENIDDLARMDVGTDPSSYGEMLHDFIMQHATTKDLGLMTRAELEDAV